MSPLFKPKSKSMPKKEEAPSPKSLPIALSVAKASKKKKMSDGGDVPEPTSSSDESIAQRILRENRSKKLDFKDEEGMTLESIKKENYAEGGLLEDNLEAGEEEDHMDSLNSLNKEAHEEIESQDEEESEHSGSPMDVLNSSMASAIRRKLAVKRGE